MRRTLVHLYGPFSIHSFGLMIALGLLVFTWLVLRHQGRKKIISSEQLIDVLLIGVVTATIGGRALYIFAEGARWDDLLCFWNGGFSILGTVLSLLIVLPWYLYSRSIPILPFFDLVALYAPLMQAISRTGCFFAGCCYGLQTQVPWAIVYSDSESIAPLGTALHPTQLYSSIALLSIFLFLYYICQPLFKKPGQIVSLYLILISIERFSVDFFRGDQEFFANPSLQLFSINQWIALALLGIAIICFCVSSYLTLNHSTSTDVR
ncbi:MAG TPA: prolipoprotein diacylglyceryl transferase [Candidatus Babeliales bacterium]|nr:prolipoprotein diacylglyceryl transferase [Candidatus Babeliales bacterium]